MSWIISFIFAGLMFTSQSNAPVYTAESTDNANAPRIVQLDETERFEQTYPLSANGKVSVENVNGSIVIEAWDKNEVKLEAVKIADTKERLKSVQIKIDAKQDYLRVETDYGRWENTNNGVWKNKNYGKLEVQYRLMVPRGAILSEICTVNGSVTISNMTNSTTASAVNGTVKGINLRGTSDLSTVNGVTEADFETLGNGNKVSMATVNGEVRLTIPSDADATIKAETVTGNIVNDFGLPVRKGRYVGKDMYGKVGAGNTSIKLESVSGELAVRRKQDGKPVKPAVNLLPEKSNSDDDDDSVVVVTPKARSAARVAQEIRSANMAVARDMERANRVDKEKAVKDAQKEVEKTKWKIATMPNMTVAIDQKELQRQVQESVKVSPEAFAKLNAVGNFKWNWTTGTPTVEKKSESFVVKGKPKVTIDAKHCRVLVRGWDKSEVQYSIVRLTRNGKPNPLDYKIDHGDTDVSIKVNETGKGDEFSDNSDQVRVEVFVPKKSNLRILTNKEIRVEGVSGDLNLTGEDESINVRDSEGKLTANSAEGSIRVIGFTGEVTSTTACGQISLEGEFQKLFAQTTEGTIILTLPEDVNATFQSNTEINAEGFDLVEDGNRWKLGEGGANYRLQTDEGQVFVRNINEIKNSY